MARIRPKRSPSSPCCNLVMSSRGSWSSAAGPAQMWFCGQSTLVFAVFSRCAGVSLGQSQLPPHHHSKANRKPQAIAPPMSPPNAPAPNSSSQLSTVLQPVYFKVVVTGAYADSMILAGRVSGRTSFTLVRYLPECSPCPNSALPPSK